MNVLKRCEQKLRVLRSSINPFSWLFVHSLKKRLPRPPSRSSDKPNVLFDVKKEDIDSDGGRYAALILIYLHLSHYRIILAPNFHFLASFKTKRYKKTLLDFMDIHLAESLNQLPEIDLWIHDDPAPSRNIKSKHEWILDYRHRIPFSETTYAIPYRINPYHYYNGSYLRIEALRKSPRRWRLFFAGNSEAKTYNRDTLRTQFGKISRFELLQLVEQSLTREQIRYLKDPLNEEKSFDGFATIDFKKYPIPNEIWLETLAHADFFLAACGVHVPMSHNVIEAMAVGTIPLIEYGEYFSPPLEHGKNCIAFSGKADFTEKLKTILDMSSEDIADLKAGVITYYQQHLEPKAVIKPLLHEAPIKKTILMNAHKAPRS